MSHVEFKKKLCPMSLHFTLMSYVTNSGADFWQNRGFNDKSVKTSKIVALDLLIKIGYGPIAQLFNMAAISKMAPKNNTNF